MSDGLERIVHRGGLAEQLVQKLDGIARDVVRWMPEVENEQHHNAVRELARCRDLVAHIVEIVTRVEQEQRPTDWRKIAADILADKKAQQLIEVESRPDRIGFPCVACGLPLPTGTAWCPRCHPTP